MQWWAIGHTWKRQHISRPITSSTPSAREEKRTLMLTKRKDWLELGLTVAWSCPGWAEKVLQFWIAEPEKLCCLCNSSVISTRWWPRSMGKFNKRWVPDVSHSYIIDLHLHRPELPSFAALLLWVTRWSWTKVTHTTPQQRRENKEQIYRLRNQANEQVSYRLVWMWRTYRDNYKWYGSLILQWWKKITNLYPNSETWQR
jgi:hypothetical protein